MTTNAEARLAEARENVWLGEDVAEARNQAEGHARGTNGDGGRSQDRKRPPLTLVEPLERATGIEPA